MHLFYKILYLILSYKYIFITYTEPSFVDNLKKFELYFYRKQNMKTHLYF